MNDIQQRLVVAAGTLAALLATTAVIAQSADTPPEARYEIDIGTTAGMMGQSDTREMTLRLGSRLPATGGAPKADHFLPDGMRMGPSVPLASPEPGKPVEDKDEKEQTERFQRPKGRLLIFWGCGAHAGPGQPVVIDFTKLAKGQVPPDLFSASIPAEMGPRAGNSRTYGEWPNGKSRAQVSKQSSLIGQHRIAGNYSPEIAFALSQDFMAPPKVKSSSAPDGSTPLNWAPVPAATGYYAWAMSAREGKDGNDMVWWASSSSRQFGGDLWRWLSPATVNRLIGQKVVMPPSQTSCTIPAEVKAAGGEMMMGFMNAFGPEANFAFPERPRDPKAAWHPKWTAKVRYRATGNFMPGMPSMGDMLMGQRGEDQDGKPEEKPKACKPKLGGFLKKAAGLGGSGC